MTTEPGPREPLIAEAGADRHRSLRNRNLTANIVFGLLGRVSSSAISLLLVPLLINFLGVDRYGVYMTITAVTGWIGIGTLGLGKGLNNAVIEAHSRGDEAAARRNIASLWAGLGALMLVTAVVLGTAFPFVPWASIFPSNLPESELKLTVLVTFSLTIVGLFLSPVFVIFSAYQNERKSTVFSVTRNATGLLAIGIAVALGTGMAGYALVAGLLATGVNVAAAGYLLFWDRPHLRPRRGDASLTLVKAVLVPSLTFFFIDLAAILAFQIDKFLVLQFTTAADVARFDLASRLFLLAFSVYQIVLGPLWPALGDALGRGDRPWARRLLRRTATLAATLMGMLTIGSLAFGDVALRIWTLRADSSPGWRVFLPLGLYFIARAVTDCHSVTLFALNRQREVLFSAVAHGILCLVLGIVLGRSYGMVGVAWSNALSFLATSAWWVPIRAWQALRDPPGSHV